MGRLYKPAGVQFFKESAPDTCFELIGSRQWCVDGIGLADLPLTEPMPWRFATEVVGNLGDYYAVYAGVGVSTAAYSLDVGSLSGAR